MAAATTEQIAKIVEEVRDGWIAEGAAGVTCVFDINSGPCYEFAGDVVSLVQERFPETVADIEDYADWLAADGLESQSIHYYVRAGGMVFDASCPEGAVTPDILPTCRSIRICAVPIGGDGDESEETETAVPAP